MTLALGKHAPLLPQPHIAAQHSDLQKAGKYLHRAATQCKTVVEVRLVHAIPLSCSHALCNCFRSHPAGQQAQHRLGLHLIPCNSICARRGLLDITKLQNKGTEGARTGKCFSGTVIKPLHSLQPSAGREPKCCCVTAHWSVHETDQNRPNMLPHSSVLALCQLLYMPILHSGEAND